LLKRYVEERVIKRKAQRQVRLRRDAVELV
jgi:hypothetical protein